MAAVGPPQQQVRMAHQQVWAALEVALRVPCLYIIDAIFNSYYDSSQSRFCIGLQIFLRLLDVKTEAYREKRPCYKALKNEAGAGTQRCEAITVLFITTT
ncbi:E3 ubiquitin-protein ligase RNF139 isoform X3 [Neomonachus schauinslandi]|uniref:E3 ubiquitin-protein ligase RNF139 isoform X3 n=1 Tax=Neomonachus schauinslandi TaxID=29088 RepID=A0A2Y9GZ03_NEOSC|nr:E3 ubiquitin-protein ligase RNF139 isoform X3 [Neomonachus schauinslandi]